MLFLSTYTNKIDKKGRVSVPSSFRVLLPKDDAGIVVYESIRSRCLEACSIQRLQHLSNSIDNLDPYSDERDAFATVILGGSAKLLFDVDGRVILPEEMTKFANLQHEACFVGKGQVFEIWNPHDYQSHYAKAKEMAMNSRGLLKLDKI